MPPLDQQQPNLSIDDLLGPASPAQQPTQAKPAHNDLTGAGYSIDDLLGPEHPPPEPPGLLEKLGNAAKGLFENNQDALSRVAQSGAASPLGGPLMDSYFSNLDNPEGLPGRILHAFGVGHSDNWGADHVQLPPQTQEWLKQAGLFDDVKKQHEDMAKSFGETFLRNGAAQMAQGAYIGRYLADTFGAATTGAWNQLKTDFEKAHPDFKQQPDTFWDQQKAQFNRVMASGKTVFDAFNLVMSPFAGAISAVAGKPFGQVVEKGTSFLPQGFQIPAPQAEEAFGEAMFGIGAEGGIRAPVTPTVPPRIEPLPPAVSRARELGNIGPEDAEPTPDVLADVEKRREEEASTAPETQPEAAPAAPKETPTPQAAPEEQAPQQTIEDVRRQIDPDLFKQYDALQTQAQTFRRWQGELRDTRDQNIRDQYEPQIAEEQAKLDAGATGRRAATYRRRIADLSEQRDKALAEAGMTPDMLRIQDAAQQVDYKLRDLAPDVSRVTQQAADQLGQAGPREALGAPAQPEAPVAETSESAEQPPAAPEQAAEAQVPPPQETPAQPPAAAPAPEPAPAEGVRTVPPEEMRPPLQGTIAQDIAKTLVKSGRTQEEAEAQAAVVQALYETRAAAFDGKKGTAEDLYRERQPEVVVSPKPYLRVPGRKGKVFGEHDDFEDEGKRIITLYGQSNVSTFMHEMGHDSLTWLMHDADDPIAPEQLKQDAQTVRDWLGVDEDGAINAKQEERFANGFERYLMEGRAPSQEMAAIFAKFKQWLTTLYQKLRPYPNAISDEMRGVFDRLLTQPEGRTVIAPHEDLLGIGERHTELAATTPPELAATTADRLQAEADDFARQEVPEIADELGAGPGERPEATGGAAPGGPPNSGGVAGQLEPAGAVGSEATGTVGAGGGEPAPQSARTTAGSIRAVEQPRTSGEQFAPGIGEPDYLDKAGNFRQETLNVPNDVWAAIKQSVERNNEFMDFRRGVVTDKDAFIAADVMGLTPAQVEKFGIGRAYTKEEIIAINKLMLQSANAIKESAVKAAASREQGALDFITDQFGNPTPTEAELEYAETVSRQRMVLDTILKRESGAFAEAGRALQAIGALKKMPGHAEAQQIADMLANSTGKTLFQMRREISAISQLKTPGQVSKATEKFSKPGLGAWALELMRNWLISGPWTHMIYSEGNGLYALYEAVGVAPTRGLVSKVHEAITGPTGEASYAHEALSELYGLYKGQASGIGTAWESFKAGQTMKLPHEELDYMSSGELERYNALRTQGPNGEAALSHEAALEKMGIKVQPQTPFTPRRDIPGPIGTIVRLPGERGIAPMHSYWRAIRYIQSVSAQAYRVARNEGLAPGSNEFTTRVAYLRGNPTEQMMQEGRDFANEGTLMGQPGSLTRKVEHVVNYQVNLPRPIGPTKPFAFVAPFLRVVSNLSRLALVENGPLGIASANVRADLTGLNGVRAQDDAIARMALGTSLTLGAGYLAMQGILPPSQPETQNYNEKRFWQMVNGYDHGMNIGGYSYDISRLGVPGMQMSLAADLYHASSMVAHGEFSQAANYFLHSVMGILRDGGIFRSFSDFFKAADDEQGFFNYYVDSLALNFVSPSLLTQASRRIDPYARQAHGFVQMWKRNLPWISEELMPKRDIWGQPVPNPSFRSVYAQELQTDSTTMGLFALGEKTGWFPGQPSRTMNGVKLTDEEYDEYSRVAGVTARMSLEAQINSPGWNEIPASHQLQIAKQAFDSARYVARAQVQGDHPRILEEMNKKTETALGKGADAALQQ